MFYPFKKGALENSDLYRAILKNTGRYIAKELHEDKRTADLVLKKILKKYGYSLSIWLENKIRKKVVIISTKYHVSKDLLNSATFYINLRDFKNIWGFKAE